MLLTVIKKARGEWEGHMETEVAMKRQTLKTPETPQDEYVDQLPSSSLSHLMPSGEKTS